MTHSSAASSPEVFPRPSALSTRRLTTFAAGAMPAYAPLEGLPEPAAMEATCVPCP
jgi:hypothetical protein